MLDRRRSVGNIASVEQQFQHAGRREAPSGTQAIDRAALLLMLVLDSPGPVGVSDLAQAAELPKSTASRLVSSLERHGLVSRTGARGKIQPGPTILRYAHRGVVDRNIVDLAQASLDALAALSGETVNLAVAGVRGVEHLAQAESRHFLGTGQWVGRDVGYHHTAVGKVLVAYGAGELPPGPLERTTPSTIVDRDAFDLELQRVRRDGFATAADELEVGLTAIAAPVPGPTGDVVAAISITGPTLRLPAQRLAELRPPLTKEARALGGRLGHREEDHEAA
jgi:IclR family transcriptional regulator, acetate operon repressor